jgi:redox-sensitive bicupin YhaK (pirin superfamily)
MAQDPVRNQVGGLNATAWCPKIRWKVTGIRHSEFNQSKSEMVHFLQIWIVPDRQGISPRYDQKRFPDEVKRGHLRLVGSPDGREGSIVIHQNVRLFATILNDGEQITHGLSPARKAWLQVIRGAGAINGEALNAGDGAAVDGISTLNIEANSDRAEFLLFDLPNPRNSQTGSSMDTILLNGRIATLDRTAPMASAVGIENGLFAAF